MTDESAEGLRLGPALFQGSPSDAVKHLLCLTDDGQRLMEQFRIDYPLVFANMTAERDETALREMGRVIYRFESSLLAERIAKDSYTRTVPIMFPRSWWQHLKHTYRDRWWMRWLVEHRPVLVNTQRVEVTIKVDRFLKYPKAAMVLRELGTPYLWENVETHSLYPTPLKEDDYEAEVGLVETEERTTPFFCQSMSPGGLPCTLPAQIMTHQRGYHSAGAVDQWPVTAEEFLGMYRVNHLGQRR